MFRLYFALLTFFIEVCITDFPFGHIFPRLVILYTKPLRRFAKKYWITNLQTPSHTHRHAHKVTQQAKQTNKQTNLKALKEFLWYAKEEKCQVIRFELRQEEKFPLLFSRAQEKKCNTCQAIEILGSVHNTLMVGFFERSTAQVQRTFQVRQMLLKRWPGIKVTTPLVSSPFFVFNLGRTSANSPALLPITSPSQSKLAFIDKSTQIHQPQS